MAFKVNTSLFTPRTNDQQQLGGFQPIQERKFTEPESPQLSPEDEQGIIADFVDKFQQGAWGAAADIVTGARGLLTDDAVWEMEQALRNRVEAQEETLSTAQKEADASFSMFGTGDKEFTGRGFGGALFQGAGSLIPSVAAGIATGGVGAVASKALGMGAKLGQVGGGALVGAPMIGGGAMNQVREELDTMPEEQFTTLPDFDMYYQTAIQQSPDDPINAMKMAREIYTQDAEQQAVQQGAALGAVTMGAAVPVLDKIVRGGAGVFGGARRGAGTEFLQEGVESGGQEAVVNPLVGRERWEGVPEAAATGAVLGGIIGGGIGGVGGLRDKPTDTGEPGVDGLNIDNTGLPYAETPLIRGGDQPVPDTRRERPVMTPGQGREGIYPTYAPGPTQAEQREAEITSTMEQEYQRELAQVDVQKAEQQEISIAEFDNDPVLIRQALNEGLVNVDEAQKAFEIISKAPKPIEQVDPELPSNIPKPDKSILQMNANELAGYRNELEEYKPIAPESDTKAIDEIENRLDTLQRRAKEPVELIKGAEPVDLTARRSKRGVKPETIIKGQDKPVKIEEQPETVDTIIPETPTKDVSDKKPVTVEKGTPGKKGDLVNLGDNSIQEIIDPNTDDGFVKMKTVKTRDKNGDWQEYKGRPRKLSKGEFVRLTGIYPAGAEGKIDNIKNLSDKELRTELNKTDDSEKILGDRRGQVEIGYRKALIKEDYSRTGETQLPITGAPVEDDPIITAKSLSAMRRADIDSLRRKYKIPIKNSEGNIKTLRLIRKEVLAASKLPPEVKPEKDEQGRTDAQLKAGNYKKIHKSWNGLDIAIENAEGTKRSGTDEDGKAWETIMQNDYGYIKRTTGADGDHVDVFMGPNLTSDKIFVVNQTNKDGSFDEHKVMVGFNSAAAAEKGYLANYQPGWDQFTDLAETTADGFKNWLEHNTQKKPANFKEGVSDKPEKVSDKDTIKKRLQRHNARMVKLDTAKTFTELNNIQVEHKADSRTPAQNREFNEHFDYVKKNFVEQAPEYTIEHHNTLVKKLNTGKMSIKEFKQSVQHFRDSKYDIITLLNSRKYTIPQLRSMAGYMMRGDEKKAEIADNVFDRLETLYLLDNPRPNLTWVMGVDNMQKGVDEQKAKITKLIDGAAQEDLDNYAEGIQEAQAKREADKKAREEAVKQPKSLDDFREFIKVKGKDALSPDQLESYDRLITAEMITRRKEVADREASRQAKSIGDVDIETAETKHTKTGEDLYVVKLADRIDRERFNTMRRVSKQYDGYYSRYSVMGAIPGFQFKSESNRDEFIAAVSTGEVKTVKKPKTNQERIAEMGDRLITKGEESLGQDRQTNTARRAGMAASAEAAAEGNIATGKLLKAIADSDTDYLHGITTLTQLEELQKVIARAEYKAPDELKDKDSMSRKTLKENVTLNDYINYAEFPSPIVQRDGLENLAKDLENKVGYKAVAKSIRAVLKRTNAKEINLDNYPKIDQAKIKKYAKLPGVYGSSTWIADYIQSSERLEKIGITSLPHLRMALRELNRISDKISGITPEQKQAKKIKTMERELVGKKIAGFFPTPDPVISRMMEEANIQEGDIVLEPSAGKGDIADALKETGAQVDTIEIASGPREILEEKGHNVVAQDFIGYKGKTYDKIVMNPPFENFQDIDHVRHAYDLLSDGGRVVAIMGAGVNNTRKKAVEFRQWVEEQGGIIESLPEGSFKSAFRTTGVNTILVTIDKQEADYSKIGKPRKPVEHEDFSFTGNTKPSGLSNRNLFNAINEIYGRPLFGASKFKNLDIINDKDSKWRGKFNPVSKEMTLNAYYISKEDVIKILHHEKLHEYIKTDAELQKIGNAIWVKAKKYPNSAAGKALEIAKRRVPKDAQAYNRRIYEETIAYLIQYYNKPRHKSVLKQYIEAVRKFFSKRFGMFMNETDAVNYVADMVKAESQGYQDVPVLNKTGKSVDDQYSDMQELTLDKKITELISKEKQLSDKVDNAYESGKFELAEKLDAELSEVREQLDSTVAQTEYDYEGDKFEDMESDLSESLKMAWGKYKDRNSYAYKNNKEFFLLARGALDSYGVDEDISDNNLMTLAKKLSQQPDRSKKLSISKTGNELKQLLKSKYDDQYSALGDVAQKMAPNFESDWIDNTKSYVKRHMWGTLNVRQISEILGKYAPLIKDKYIDRFKLYESDMNEMKQIAGDIANIRQDLPKDINEKLAKVQSEATIEGYDPSFEKPEDDNQQSIKSDYLGLSPAAKKVYKEERDYHKNMHDTRLKELKNRINDIEGDQGFKELMIDKLTEEFSKASKNGPYFPLARFGQFWVSSENAAGEKSFDMFENETAQARFKEQLRATPSEDILGSGRQLDKLQEVSKGIDGKFIAEIDKLVKKAGGDNSLRDNIFQLYLESLPELSSRKKYLHRKKTKGFSKDQAKAFAHAARADANDIARIKHIHVLQDMIDQTETSLNIASSRTLKKQFENHAAALQKAMDETPFEITDQDITDLNEQAPFKTFQLQQTGDPEAEIKRVLAKEKSLLKNAEKIDETKITFVSSGLSELKASHEAMVNANVHPIASGLNSLGFLWYLGASPAAALVNLTQTPTVALPMMLADKALKGSAGHLTKAVADFMKGKGSIEPTLDANEKKAFEFWHKSGLLENTQAHDLSGIADSGIDTGTFKNKAMRMISFMFHRAEVMNREVTALATYRAAIEGGMKPADAMKKASDLTWDSHLDYGASNRARFMRGNFARVITQFKQYSQGITYIYARTAFQAFKGESKQDRQQAMKLLGMLVGSQISVAGTLGLPMAGIVMGIAQGLEDALGDDDDPVSIKAEFRQAMADFAGKRGGQAISHGLIDAFTPLSVSGRLSMADLWVRTPDYDLEGKAEALSYVEALGGPMVSIFTNTFMAKQAFKDGDYIRAMESMTPKFIKDFVRSGRYAGEGNLTRAGLKIKDMTPAEMIGQALGFSASEVSEIRERATGIKNIERQRAARRKDIIDSWIADDDGAMRDIPSWNVKHPRDRITGDTLRRAKRSKLRYAKQVTKGVRETKRTRDLIEKYDY